MLLKIINYELTNYQLNVLHHLSNILPAIIIALLYYIQVE